jgi:hypothetical protein
MSTPGPQSAVPSKPIETPIPGDKTLKHAARIALEQDKPIMLDYYVDTCEGKAFMGKDGVTGEKMLVRSEEEYTSVIQNTFKVNEDYIVVTENSVYLISGATKMKTFMPPSSA